MIDLAILVIDVLRWAVVIALFAFVAHQLLALLAEARWLDDDDPGWSDTPGARNDRARLLEDRLR